MNFPIDTNTFSDLPILRLKKLQHWIFTPKISIRMDGVNGKRPRITCMRILKTNQWKITRPLSIRVHTFSRQSVAQYLFQLAHWRKKHFVWGWYCGKKQIDMCFIVVCTLIDNDYASLIFSQTFFRIVSAFWASLPKVLKGKSNAYKKLICIMYRAHFQGWVSVFSCQQILIEISFVIFDTVVKTNRMSFSAALVKIL